MKYNSFVENTNRSIIEFEIKSIFTRRSIRHKYFRFRIV